MLCTKWCYRIHPETKILSQEVREEELDFVPVDTESVVVVTGRRDKIKQRELPRLKSNPGKAVSGSTTYQAKESDASDHVSIDLSNLLNEEPIETLKQGRLSSSSTLRDTLKDEFDAETRTALSSTKKSSWRGKDSFLRQSLYYEKEPSVSSFI